jgi:hypothetical protein
VAAAWAVSWAIQVAELLVVVAVVGKAAAVPEVMRA